MNSTQEKAHLEIIDSCQRDQDESAPAKSTADENNLDSFTSFLEESIANEIHTIFNTLKSPRREAILKTRSPCMYVFPGGFGDSAIFSINGFNMLVNGGSRSKPCFWKLVKHIDRVDCILATHLGADNLPGINSFLMRKLQEQQIKLPIDSTSEEYQELRRCLISPQLGPMFINVPLQYLESVSKSSPRKPVAEVENLTTTNGSHDQLIFKVSDVIKETIRLTKALDLQMTPLHRKPASHEPITLFSKWGCGKLDMYVLNPCEGSKELNYMNDKWGVAGNCKIPVGKSGVLNEAGQEGMTTYADLCSIAILLVWHPSDPNEKIVRVLLPGNTSQPKIFDGLDGISDLPFMKVQHATASVLQAMKDMSKANGASSTQKPPRAASVAKSAGTVNKKFAPSIGKKSNGSSNSLMKESVSSHTKVSDKRAKSEKPSITKPKSATGKSATLKEKPNAGKSSRGTGGQVSTRSTPANSATKRSQPVPSSKSDMKRPASKTASTKVKTTEKIPEKSKKPAYTAQKAKADVTKPTARNSPRQVTSKTTTKPAREKGAKVTKDASQTSPSSRQTDSSVDASQTATIPDVTPNLGTSQDVGVDDLNKTVLSERRSPDGGDGSSVQCAFDVASGKTEAQSTGDGEMKSDVDCDDLQLVMNKLCVSEESNMISTESSKKAVELMDQPVIHGHEISDLERANGQDIKAEDAAVSQNVMTIDTAATATLQQDDNRPVEEVEQCELQSDDLGDGREVNQLVDSSSSQLAQVAVSDIQSSSVEGSYELCSTGKSPLLGSAQETIAETISDFKLDEPAAAAEEEPTAEFQTPLLQTDVVEEHTISTEAFDANDDISTGLTTSVVAQVDPPFSSSDASHSTKDVAPGQELAQGAHIAPENAGQYEIEVEETKEPDDFALTDHHEDPLRVTEEAMMSGSEEDHDDKMAGAHEDGVPTVVDSVPWNKPVQHLDSNLHQGDPVETLSNDIVHLSGAEAEVEVGKIISLSEKELLHQDEKDDVSGKESSENFDADKSGSTSEDQFELEIQEALGFLPEPSERFSGNYASAASETSLDQNMRGVASVPEASQYAGVYNATDASETEFPCQNDQQAVSIPGAVEYSSRDDVIDASDQLLADANGQESMSVLKDSEYSGADVPNDPLGKFPDQNEYESVSIPETYDYSGTCDAENVPENEIIDPIEQECAFSPETSEYSDQENAEESSHDDVIHQYQEEFVSGTTAHFESDTKEMNKGNEDNATFPQHVIEDSDHFDETNDQDGHSEGMQDDAESQLHSTNNTVNDNELHATNACRTLADVEKSCTVAEQHDEGEAGLKHSSLSCDPETQSEFLKSEEEVAVVHAKIFEMLGESDPVNASLLAGMKEYEATSKTMDDGKEAGSIVTEEVMDSGEFQSLHGGDNDAEVVEEQVMPQTSRQDPIEETSSDRLDKHMSGDWRPLDQSTVDQQSTCPISVSTDAKVLDANADQGETQQFDSPLNASAVPFIPATMQPDQLKSNDEQLGDEQGAAAHEARDVAATMPPASTNPFLLDMLADCPSTVVEPEELFLPPTRDQDPCAGQDKFGKATLKKSSQARKPSSSHVYVDLTYIPNHCDEASVGADFFKKIRSRYYVISGTQLPKDQPSTNILDYLLQGRKFWLSNPGKNAGQEDSNVTVIPTHDTPSLQQWYKNNYKDLVKHNVHLIASGSKVVMQEESIEACKIEF